MTTTVSKKSRFAFLASGLCQDASVEIEVMDNVDWAWDPLRRVITVPLSELETKSDTYCAGIIAHEVGHYYISRYLHFSETDLFPKHYLLLLNALEDSRIEDWMCKRYPGTCVWLKEVSESTAIKDLTSLPDFLLFSAVQNSAESLFAG